MRIDRRDMGIVTPRLDLIARRTSPDVFHALEWGTSWGREVIDDLKTVAEASERSRARLCLHPTPEDQHQEMLIVMKASAIERAQRRTTGFDTKIVVEGRATLHYFTPVGRPTRAVSLGDDHAMYVQTRSAEYHSLLVESDWFVFLEILQGPFNAATTEFAAWDVRLERSESNE